jgi:hypothetical protein
VTSRATTPIPSPPAISTPETKHTPTPATAAPELAIPVPTVLPHATILDAAKWAGATFIAVTMLLLKIRELMR